MTNTAQRADDELTIGRNVESIDRIPATHITPERRAELRQCAAEGQDVYAYPAGPEHSVIWNTWQWDTRIPLYPVEQWAWGLTTSHRLSPDNHQWVLTFASRVMPQQLAAIAVTIERQLSDKSKDEYLDRMPRVIAMIEGYINLYREHPNHYANCRF